MDELIRVCQQFQGIANEKKLGVFIEPATISVCSEPVSIQEDLISAIQNFGAEDGWLTTQKSNIKLDEWRNSQASMGAILQAELVKGETSLHVRQARNGWIVTRLQEVAEGERCLAEERRLASRNEGEYLRYRIYWQSQPGFGFRASYFRFAGFEKGARHE